MINNILFFDPEYFIHKIKIQVYTSVFKVRPFFLWIIKSMLPRHYKTCQVPSCDPDILYVYKPQTYLRHNKRVCRINKTHVPIIQPLEILYGSNCKIKVLPPPVYYRVSWHRSVPVFNKKLLKLLPHLDIIVLLV